MNNLILIMSICSFMANGFLLIANVTGGVLWTFIAKTIGLFGTLCPVLYWLKLLQII